MSLHIFLRSTGKSVYQQPNETMGTQGENWKELDIEPEYTIWENDLLFTILPCINTQQFLFTVKP